MTATRWNFHSADATAARAVRHSFVAYAHAAWTEASVDTTAAELVLGELIGNVTRHAPGPVVVDVEWNALDVIIAVSDHGRGFILPKSVPIDILAESGRGMFIAKMYSSELAVSRTDHGGSRVRVVVPLIP